jgi:uncharacterized membrane protein YqaE (UPF0057 family)
VTTWTEIFADLADPIEGDVAKFESADSTLVNLTSGATAVAESISKFQGSACLASFAGESANAFRREVAKLDSDFQNLPLLTADVQRCIHSHASNLKALRERANGALARAEVKWREKETAESDLDSATTRSVSLQRQLDYLVGVTTWDDPAAVARLDVQREAVATAARGVDQASRVARRVGADLELFRTEHARLSDDEQVLNHETVHRLNTIDLRGLHDPSLAERAYDGINAFLDDPLGFVEAVLERIGNLLLDVLFILKDVLEILSLLLVIVAILLPPLALLLAGVAFAAAFVSFLITWLMYETSHPHPFTGDRISEFDLSLSALSLITAGIAGWAAKGVQVTFKEIGRHSISVLDDASSTASVLRQRLKDLEFISDLTRYIDIGSSSLQRLISAKNQGLLALPSQSWTTGLDLVELRLVPISVETRP